MCVCVCILLSPIILLTYMYMAMCSGTIPLDCIANMRMNLSQQVLIACSFLNLRMEPIEIPLFTLEC